MTKCIKCGSEFKAISVKHICCSPACRAELENENKRRAYEGSRSNKRLGKNSYHCDICCGRVGKRPKMYCSPECSRVAIRIKQRIKKGVKFKAEDAEPRTCPCGASFKPIRPTEKFCTQKCSDRYWGHHRKRRIIVQASTADFVDQDKVFTEANWICAHCSRKTDPALNPKKDSLAPQLDHIIPLSKGGAHSYKNVQLLCRECNMKKGNKMPASGGEKAVLSMSERRKIRLYKRLRAKRNREKARQRSIEVRVV